MWPIPATVPEGQVLLGVLLAAAVALISFRAGLLTAAGAGAQWVAGSLLFGLGAWQWAVPVVVFFAGSALLSRITRSGSRPGSDLFAKGERRDAVQVAANGGLASFLVIPWLLTGSDLWFVAYLGAVAASAADTWATEVGMTSARPPRSIRSMAPVEPGESGGVTPRGMAAAATGALVIAITGLWWTALPGAALAACACTGFGASLLDSLLGATVQVQYRCEVCGRSTERRTHCGIGARNSRGYRSLGNDMVNLISSSAGGGAAALLYSALAPA